MIISTVLWVLLGLAVAACVLYVVGVYNAKVRLAKIVGLSFGNLESTLKQRHDEIPKLVDACKVYMGHEKGLLERLTELRTGYSRAVEIDEKVRIENELNREMTRLGHTWEGYPDLKANESFLQVQGRMSHLETIINDRRELFNQAVTDHNTLIAQFPALVIARLLGLAEIPLLEISEEDTRDNLRPFSSQD